MDDPRPRPGQDPGRLQRPADDRDGALQARRAQAARRAARGAADRRHRRGRPVRDRAHPPHALDPRLQRRRAQDRRSARSSSPATTSSTRRRSAARPADMARLAELGREGLLLLCGDSTNVDRAGRLGAASRSSARTWTACSRAARAASSSPASRRTSTASSRSCTPPTTNGRKVALVGRSMRKNVNIGRSLGHIDIPEGMLRAAARDRPVGRREDRRHLHRLPGRAAVGAAPDGLPRPPAGRAQVAATPWSSARRRSPATSARSTRRSTGSTTSAARSSRPRDAPIHASGHGYAEEVKMMINLTRPKYVMPVHGDYKRMLIHCELAQAVGVPASHIFRTENGTPLEIDAEGARLGKPVQAGHDLRRRRRHRRRVRRRAARPPHAQRRRHLHHRGDGLRAGRLVRRPARGDRARRPVPGGQQRLHRRAARGGRGLARPRRRAADHRDRRAAVASCTTTSRSSSTTGSSAARWCLPVVVEV